MRGAAAFKLPQIVNNGYDRIEGFAPMQQMTAAWSDYPVCTAGGLGGGLCPPGLSSHMVNGPGVHSGPHLGPVGSWNSMYSVNNNTLSTGPEPGLACAHMLTPSAADLSPYAAPSTVGQGPSSSAPASLSIDPGPLSGAVVPPGPNGGVGKPAPGKVNRKTTGAAKRRRGAGGVGGAGHLRASSRSPSSLLPGDEAGGTPVTGSGSVPSLAAAVAAAANSANGATPSGSHKSCVVCSDRAVNNNFGQITCESCKAFFRRNAHKMEKLNCTGKGRCQITTDSRKNCPRCRLEKCFHMGMRKELIQVRKKDGSAPKWLEGNSPDSGGSGSGPVGPNGNTHSQSSSRPSQGPQPQPTPVSVQAPVTGMSSSRPLSVGSSTEGSPALEVGHMMAEASSGPFHPPSHLQHHSHAPSHAASQPPLGASSPVAAAVCISPRQARAPTAAASGLTAFDCPAPEFGQVGGPHQSNGGASDAWTSLSPSAGPAASTAPSGLAAAMFNCPSSQYGASDTSLSYSMHILSEVVGPKEDGEMRSGTPDKDPLLVHLDSLLTSLFDNFSYNNQKVSLEGISLEYEASWGLEFAVLADILLRQLIHFLRHNEVTKYDSTRQDIEAIKVGLMNALPIFLALNYDRGNGCFRFTVDGHIHVINGQRLEAALASILPPETDILKYLVRYNTSVAALLHHKRDLFGLYLLLKIMAPSSDLAADTTTIGCMSSHNLASASHGAFQSTHESHQCRYNYKDIYDMLSRSLRELNQTEANTLSEMLVWSQGFDKAFRKAFSVKLSSHPPQILPKLVYEFVNTGTSNPSGRRMATSL